VWCELYVMKDSHTQTQNGSSRRPARPPSPLQDIVSLQSFIVEVNHPFNALPHLQSLPYCNTLLHDHCAIYARPPTLPFDAIHHTILVMAISCKGQRPPLFRSGKLLNAAPLASKKDAYAALDSDFEREQLQVTYELVTQLCIGLHTILPLPILYGVWHTKGGAWGGRVMR